MKIGIITLHYNLNYGALLQTYALQKTLQDMGYDVEIINYVDSKTACDLKFFGKDLIRNIRSILFAKKRIQRIKAFKEFMAQELNISKQLFSKPSDITNEKLNYDVYITGSDQTFNFYLLNNKKNREAYFLPLVENENKFSYASSMGEDLSKFNESDMEWLKTQLSKYKMLSVREESAADFIENLGLKRPQVALDPTLLFGDEKWSGVSKETKHEKNSYILFYSVLSSKWIVDSVVKISKELGLKVIAPHLKNRLEMKTNFIRAEECGPKEFISLVKNAAFVCTSSFHGTVFSLLFRKKFLSFAMFNNGRIENLLNKVGLEKLLVKEKDDIQEKLIETEKIDFNVASEKLEEEREKSLLYLKNIL